MTDDVEFDIQKTILKKKERKNSKFYVEYDKLTSQVLGITPEKISPSSIRNGLLELEENELIKEIFNNNVSLYKLRIYHDYDTNSKILTRQRELHYNEFDYITAKRNDTESFIYLYCDVVAKKIAINFINSNFMNEYTVEKANEQILSNLPEDIIIYCIDKFDPSKLFATLSVNVKELFAKQELRFSGHWLPNDVNELEHIDFLYHNSGISISVRLEPLYVPVASVKLKPAIIYEQHQQNLKIQSVIGDYKNFYLENKIKFYVFDANDPSQILDVICLNTVDLNNFNSVEIKLKTNKAIKLISNYNHLHIEEAHVNTYY